MRDVSSPQHTTRPSLRTPQAVSAPVAIIRYLPSGGLILALGRAAEAERGCHPDARPHVKSSPQAIRLEVTVVLAARIGRRLLLTVVTPTLQRAVGTKRARVPTPRARLMKSPVAGGARDLTIRIIAPTVDPADPPAGPQLKPSPAASEEPGTQPSPTLPSGPGKHSEASGEDPASSSVPEPAAGNRHPALPSNFGAAAPLAPSPLEPARFDTAAANQQHAEPSRPSFVHVRGVTRAFGGTQRLARRATRTTGRTPHEPMPGDAEQAIFARSAAVETSRVVFSVPASRVRGVTRPGSASGGASARAWTLPARPVARRQAMMEKVANQARARAALRRLTTAARAATGSAATAGHTARCAPGWDLQGFWRCGKPDSVLEPAANSAPNVLVSEGADASGPYLGVARSPPIDLSRAGQPLLEFYLSMRAARNDAVANGHPVRLGPAGASPRGGRGLRAPNVDPIYTGYQMWSESLEYSFARHRVDLSAFSGKVIRLDFEFDSDYDAGDHVLIDDVSVYDASLVPAIPQSLAVPRCAANATRCARAAGATVFAERTWQTTEDCPYVCTDGASCGGTCRPYDSSCDPRASGHAPGL